MIEWHRNGINGWNIRIGRLTLIWSRQLRQCNYAFVSTRHPDEFDLTLPENRIIREYLATRHLEKVNP